MSTLTCPIWEDVQARWMIDDQEWNMWIETRRGRGKSLDYSIEAVQVRNPRGIHEDVSRERLGGFRILAGDGLVMFRSKNQLWSP